MRILIPVLLLIGFALPLSAQEGQPQAGRVTIPYLFGDGGMVALQAGEVLPVTWNEAPSGAVIYIFWWRSYFSPLPSLIGIDFDLSDGVSVRWKIPEHMSGMPYGIAVYADGTHVVSDNRESGLEYGSGSAPPEGICSVRSSGMEGTSVFAESTTKSTFLGQLEGYAPARGQVDDEEGIPWIQIELSSTAVYRYQQDDPLPETGWVFANFVHMFGDCSFLEADR